MAQLLHTVMQGDLAPRGRESSRRTSGAASAAYHPRSALGEMLALGFNPRFSWACSPTATELECLVMDWFARELGLPPAYRVRESSSRLTSISEPYIS